MSVGGKTRTDSTGEVTKGWDHDPPAKQKLVPIGILMVACGALMLLFSSRETSDAWVDALQALDHRLGHRNGNQAADWFRLERAAAGRAGTSSRSRTYSNRSRGLASKKRSAAVVPSGRRIR
jgi:hypothetical protein